MGGAIRLFGSVIYEKMAAEWKVVTSFHLPVVTYMLTQLNQE